MGYMRHHAIVVSCSYGDWIDRAHKVASDLFRDDAWGEGHHVSPITSETTNGYRSFFIAPDGSKEGWGESNSGDERRDKFVTWLRQQAYEDGSSPLGWVEVQYADDDRETRVTRHSDERHADKVA